MPGPIAALLARWLPGRDLAVSRAASGQSTEVYRVRSGDETYWLRLAEESGENRVAEYRVHQVLRERGARVPEILRYETAPPELDRSAALTSAIPGIPLRECRDPATAQAVAAAAGHDLATINALAVRGFGWLDRVRQGEPGIVAEHPARAGWTADYLAAVTTLATTHAIAAPLIAPLHDRIVAWAGDGAQALAWLAHGDFDATHIYFDPDSGAYTGIIDFGEGRGADPTYDLGHLLLHDGEAGHPPVFDACRAGWGGADATCRAAIRQQAIAIATRQLARVIPRPPSRYRDWLATRLTELLREDAPS